MKTNINLSKTQIYKIIQFRGFFLAQLGITATASAINTGTQKNVVLGQQL